MTHKALYIQLIHIIQCQKQRLRQNYRKALTITDSKRQTVIYGSELRGRKIQQSIRQTARSYLQRLSTTIQRRKRARSNMLSPTVIFSKVILTLSLIDDIHYWSFIRFLWTQRIGAIEL